MPWWTMSPSCLPATARWPSADFAGAEARHFASRPTTRTLKPHLRSTAPARKRRRTSPASTVRCMAFTAGTTNTATRQIPKRKRERKKKGRKKRQKKKKKPGAAPCGPGENPPAKKKQKKKHPAEPRRQA